MNLCKKKKKKKAAIYIKHLLSNDKSVAKVCVKGWFSACNWLLKKIIIIFAMYTKVKQFVNINNLLDVN